ncbi:MAG: D-glycero-beta-D-manno-heptose 1-phosphate adenylyltransferase [Maricaulis sp.]|jgi:D-beta-D-heptose 7-phosphate kinase/D-beta-D-heptose 1-phosphate adenosyltransferase|nr:D-glycero-beta-D-manno-heptose 1-phosphate adenylyltransferase [Maricaulis sp.]HAQ33758.1 D-glycero-beta-D-manno-heptose 1-phosphate adenylyltransferase [Alphaproteobacteria bacterium]
MDIAELSDLLDRIKGLKVLCVGDIVLDQFIYGETNRVSREAPVPILEEKRRDTMLGASGNVVRNLVSLGAKPIPVSLIGDDREGETLLSLLDADGVTRDHLVVETGRRSAMKTRFVSAGHQMLCVDRDPLAGRDGDTEARLIAAIESAAPGADAAILSDYGRGLVSRAVSQTLIKACRKAGIPVCVDPRGRDYSRYDGATVIKPNALELSEECGSTVASDDEAIAGLNAVMSGLKDTDALIVTRSSLGMTALNRDGSSFHVRSRPRPVYDVSGAGDTAISMLALALGAKASLETSMRAADLAAGLVVTKVGTATVSADELLAEARLRESGEASAKLKTRAALCDSVARWKAVGLKVGFTNGCFDILHPGHVSLLRQARAECDRLVVGLNSDASVKRLKGEGRPVNNEMSRAIVMASLESVDQIVFFDEDTPVSLIEAIKPDVYVKGADYTVEALAPLGGDAVVRHGGRIHLARLEDGHSTTEIIRRSRAGT